MDYTNLLKRAWELVWNNKFMFVLGFLAALSGGGGGGGGGNFNSGSPGSGDDITLPPDVVNNIEQFWVQYAVLIVAVIIFFILLGIAFWLLSMIGRAGMVSSAVRLDAGETVTLRDAFSVGTSKLGSMVGLSLLMYGPFILFGLIAFVAFAATIGTAVLAEFSGSGGDMEALGAGIGGLFICFGLLACLIVPLSLLVSVVYPFAMRGLVLYDYGAVESVRHGWQIVKENVGDIIVLAILFFVIGILFGIVAAIVLVPLAAIIFLPTILPMINSGTVQIANIVILIIGGIFLGVAGAAINSIFISFRSTAVTLAYQQFIGKNNVEKEVQLV